MANFTTMSRGFGLSIVALLIISVHFALCHKKGFPSAGGAIPPAPGGGSIPNPIAGATQALPPPFDSIGKISADIIANNVNRDEKAAALPEALASARGVTLKRTKITSESYHIDIFEIPKAASCGTKTCTPVILLAEGNCMAAQWIMGDKTNSLGYLLADNCSPVILQNHRGSVFADRDDINRKQNKYWHFSWEELALDFAATLDYTLKQFNVEKVNAVGYSQGASVIMILLSTLTIYNSKIKSVLLISPFTNWKHSECFKEVPAFVHPVAVAALDAYEIAQVPVIPNSADVMACFIALNFKDNGNDLSGAFARISGGVDADFDEYLTNTFKTCMNSGISLRSCAHVPYFFTQEGNFVGWKKTTPFDLSKVTAKCHIMYSTTDKLVSTTDLKEATGKMPNVEYHEINLPRFGHYNFVIDSRSHDAVTKPSFEIIKKETECIGG